MDASTELLNRLRSARENGEIASRNDEALGLLMEIEGYLAKRTDNPTLWSLGMDTETALDWFEEWFADSEGTETVEAVLGEGYDDLSDAGLVADLVESITPALSERVIIGQKHRLTRRLDDYVGDSLREGVWGQMHEAVSDHSIDELSDLVGDDAFWIEQLAKFRAAHPVLEIPGTSALEADVPKA